MPNTVKKTLTAGEVTRIGVLSARIITLEVATGAVRIASRGEGSVYCGIGKSVELLNGREFIEPTVISDTDQSVIFNIDVLSDGGGELQGSVTLNEASRDDLKQIELNAVAQQAITDAVDIAVAQAADDLAEANALTQAFDNWNTDNFVRLGDELPTRHIIPANPLRAFMFISNVAGSHNGASTSATLHIGGTRTNSNKGIPLPVDASYPFPIRGEIIIDVAPGNVGFVRMTEILR